MKNLHKFRKLFFSILIVSFFIQCLFADYIPLLCSAVVLITTVFTVHTLFQRINFEMTPLSTMAVFYFNIANLSGPLIGQSLSFNPIDYNLDSPLLTFITLAIEQLVLNFAQYL